MPGLTSAFRAQAVHAGRDPLPGIGARVFPWKHSDRLQAWYKEGEGISL